jgi:hypothetical protein
MEGKMANALAIASDGSKPLKNNMHERYARLRARALPRLVAFRKAGNTAKNDRVADRNSFRLERKPGVRERIEYLVGLAQDRIAEKRAALEEQLWSVMEGDIGNYFETIDAIKPDKNGVTLTIKKQRPRLLSDLPPEFRKLIEDVTVDRNGNVIPKLYSKAQANAELRKLHNFGRTDDRQENELSRLSDAELLSQLADLSKQLGVEMKLDVEFAAFVAGNSAATQPASSPPVVDVTPDVTADVAAADAADVAAAAELKIAAKPAVAGARPVRKARGSKA